MRKLRNPVRWHRPSPAMCVSLVALFVALSGGAYAAVTIPAKSIGATQLKSFAVTNPKLGVSSVGSRKIMPGAVGFYRVNRNEVQLRVTGTCTGTDQAITSVSVTGTTTCGTSSPAESDSGVGKQTTIAAGTTATSLASYSIAGGTAYQVQADPSIEVSGGAGTAGAHVLVTCTLAAGTSTTAVDTENVTVNVDGAGDTEYASVPLKLIAPTNANAETATLGCTQTTTGTPATAPTVAGTGRIYALGVNPATTTTTAAAVRH